MNTPSVSLHSTRSAFNFRLFRLIERLLKYMVILSDIMMTVHCFTLLADTHLWVAEFVAGYSVFGFVALYLASFLLHFCWRYRLCLVHAFAVNCCITFQREADFGCCLTTMRWLMFVIGIVAIVMASHSTLTGRCKHHGVYNNEDHA